MDKMKRSRTITRAAFTRNLGALNTELASGSPNIAKLQVQFEIVKEKADLLEEISRKIFEVMIDNDYSEEDLLQ